LLVPYSPFLSKYQPDLVQAFNNAVGNIIEFDEVLDQHPAAIRKIGF
jgi:hypothetical protein